MVRTAARKPGSRNERFTPLEAAWLTNVSSKAINKLIDRGEFGGATGARSGARRLGFGELVYLCLREELGTALSPTAREEVYSALLELTRGDFAMTLRRPEKSWPNTIVALAGGVLRVDLKSAMRNLAERLAELRGIDRAIVSDPDVRSGEPVVRGTRVPVYTIAALVEQGAKPKEILEDYPSLSAAKVQAALAYAATRPKRGRPRKAPWRANAVSDR
jgi:uncharacterized protein (DUF433 family)